jgi:hypothetical protein
MGAWSLEKPGSGKYRPTKNDSNPLIFRTIVSRERPREVLLPERF